MTESVPDGFFNYHWVDDHINVARMVGPQLQDAERSLRSAMISVFGSPAINEDKFTGWHMQLKVLGLLFDTVACTVAMPAVKIQKASQLVLAAYHSETMSRKAYRSLLGSLRHVATCIRSARPFLQRLRVQELGLQHRFGKVTVSEPMRHDLVWWWKILQSPDLNGVPMRFFHALPSHDVVVEMDASDHGLCALDMTYKCLFTYEYSVHERVLISEFKSRHDNEFDINFRELLSAAFVVFLWGPRWSNIQSDTQVHVHFRIDNTSAVSWQTKMGSRNARAQVLLRLLGYWEHSYGLRFSSSHIAGVDNVYDLASYLRSHSVATSTHAKYLTAFDQWTYWCARVGHNAFMMELSDKQRRRAIEGFIIHGFKIGYGSGRRLKSTTISAILHGIKHFFIAHGVDFPCGHPQLRMLIKGVIQFDAPRQHKAPVSIAIMEAIFGSLCLARSSDQALWGVLCISLFFLLRRSEIVAIQGSDFKWFALKAEDLVVVDRLGVPTSCPASADAVYLKLRGSKTNQAGPATVRMLKRSEHPALCPVVEALLLHQARLSIPTSLPAAVYSVYNKGQYCIATSHVSSAIQRAAIQLGEDPKLSVPTR